MVEYINCQRCWKEIQKKSTRVLCIACSNKRDKEVSKKYREEHREEIRERNRETARKRAGKKPSSYWRD